MGAEDWSVCRGKTGKVLGEVIFGLAGYRAGGEAESRDGRGVVSGVGGYKGAGLMEVIPKTEGAGSVHSGVL